MFPPPLGRAIELGCGNGVALVALAELGFEAFGIDISPTAVEWALERADELGISCRAICGSVTDMSDFPDGHFQLAYDGACFHCLFADERGKALSEVFRTLQPRGIFVLSSMCGTPRKLPFGQRFDQERGLVLAEDDTPHRTLRPRSELEAEVADAGFQLVAGTVNENPWWDHLNLVVRKPG